MDWKVERMSEYLRNGETLRIRKRTKSGEISMCWLINPNCFLFYLFTLFLVLCAPGLTWTKFFFVASYKVFIFPIEAQGTKSLNHCSKKTVFFVPWYKVYFFPFTSGWKINVRNFLLTLKIWLKIVGSYKVHDEIRLFSCSLAQNSPKILLLNQQWLGVTYKTVNKTQSEPCLWFPPVLNSIWIQWCVESGLSMLVS